MLLIAVALFSFEILSTRTISFVIGSGYFFFAIALAMLAASGAGSLVSVLRLNATEERWARILFASCVMLALLMMGAHYATVLFKDLLNNRIAAQGLKSGMAGAVLQTASIRLGVALCLGIVLSLPYFLCGMIISLLFRKVDGRFYNKLYFSDLVGGSVGCVLAYGLMEYGPYTWSLILPPVCCLAAATVFIRQHSKKAAWITSVAAAAILIAFQIPLLQYSIEPRPDIHNLASDFSYRSPVQELWHGWNSFSRISAVRKGSPTSAVQAFMTYGNGEGQAVLKEYRWNRNNQEPWEYSPSRLAMALGIPKRVLVLFAGTGADMLGIDNYSGGQSDITGVEINNAMIKGARMLPGFGLKEFYEKKNIHLTVAEARAFLERDTQKYDVILLSWSGATMVYYDGSVSSTAQHVFTREAMESILDHLNPNGFAIYLSTNKVNVLATLRSIMDERKFPHPEKAAVVLYPATGAGFQWNTLWDSNPTFVKPNGFSPEEVERIKSAGESIRASIAYTPYNSPAAGVERVYETVLTDPNLSSALDRLGKRTNMQFGIPTDDRPFAFDFFRTSTYFTREFWRLSFSSNFTIERASDFYRGQNLLFLLVIAVVSIVLILGPLLLKNRIRTRSGAANHFAFFAALGAGFMLLEVGIIQKTRLIFGTPGLSIAIVLAALVFFTGIGSLASSWLSACGLTARGAGLLMLAYGGLFVLSADFLFRMAMTWSLFLKSVWIISLLAPLAFLMGQFMPQGLIRARRDDESLVPWGLAVNGVAGTFVAGIVPLFSMAVGFQIVMLSGLACYAVIVLLSRDESYSEIKRSELQISLPERRTASHA